MSVPPRTRCEEPGCNRTTHERKPFCYHHLERIPYVQEVLGRMARMAAERRRVRRAGPAAVDPQGITAREVLLRLEEKGPRSAARLARDLKMDARTLGAYLDSLQRQGRVRIEPGRVVMAVSGAPVSAA